MKIAYHTPTKEIYIKQVKKWLDEGKCWSSGSEEINETYWDVYKEQTCVALSELNRIEYANKQFYLQYNYKIMPVEKSLDTLEANDLLKYNDLFYRVLDVRGEGELQLIDLSYGSTNKESDNLKEHADTLTLFQIKRSDYTFVTEKERTINDVLSSLSDEDKEIVRKEMENK